MSTTPGSGLDMAQSTQEWAAAALVAAAPTSLFGGSRIHGPRRWRFA
jgi:hypothetical protein